MIRYLPMLLLFLSLALLAALALADSPISVAPKEGVLLLRTGRVFKGKITRDGELYIVALPVGAIYFKAGKVDRVCANLRECYLHKRSRVIFGNANEHLELAAWCIAQELFKEAEAELAFAQRAEPRHPKISLLERRLRTIQSRPSSASPSATSKAVGPSNADLQAMMRQLPAGAVETFTGSIQPILHNHCSTAGCHGSNTKTGFRLIRLPRRRIHQGLTQRNLHATLKMINREKPGDSPLLQKPINPHGALKKAIFEDRDVARYHQLVAWVYQVAGAIPPSKSHPQSEQPPLLQADTSATENISGSAKPAESQAFNPRSVAENAIEPPSRRRLREAMESHRGFTPRDPFDAEIFNRRHFPKRARRRETSFGYPPRPAATPWSSR